MITLCALSSSILFKAHFSSDHTLSYFEITLLSGVYQSSLVASVHGKHVSRHSGALYARAMPLHVLAFFPCLDRFEFRKRSRIKRTQAGQRTLKTVFHRDKCTRHRSAAALLGGRLLRGHPTLNAHLALSPFPGGPFFRKYLLTFCWLLSLGETRWNSASHSGATFLRQLGMNPWCYS